MNATLSIVHCGFHAATLLLLVIVTGCTSIRPQLDDRLGEPAPLSEFSYDSYARILENYVTDDGRVSYQQLAENLKDVELFYQQIATYSPDSHPLLFPDEAAQLAYWINSYNFTVLKGVLHYYPISSVADVPPPYLLFFLPQKSGFFVFQRFTYGNAETNLWTIENRVIRKRFSDPRYHFALNCASKSCPELPQTPFSPQILDAQLHQEALDFVNDNRNVRYDSRQKKLYLSSIFKWYEKDFINWLNQSTQADSQGIIDYLLPYLDEATARMIALDRNLLTISYLPYDWGLNDANGK